MSETDCVFCRIITGQEHSAQVYADELCVAFMDIYPLGEGHVLLIPRQHVGQLHELDEATRTHMFAVFDRLLAAQRRAGLGLEGTNLLVNDGKAANQHIPHAHMHLIPRRPRDGVRFLYRLFLHVTGIFGFARPMDGLRRQAAGIAAEMEAPAKATGDHDVAAITR